MERLFAISLQLNKKYYDLTYKVSGGVDVKDTFASISIMELQDGEKGARKVLNSISNVKWHNYKGYVNDIIAVKCKVAEKMVYLQEPNIDFGMKESQERLLKVYEAYLNDMVNTYRNEFGYDKSKMDYLLKAFED